MEFLQNAELFMGISFRVNLASGKLLLPGTKFSKLIISFRSSLGNLRARECLMADACILSGIRINPRLSCGEEVVITNEVGIKVFLVTDV